MKALVTGASGFIGSTLIGALADEGYEVFALMRKTSSEKNLRGLRYTRVEGDLTDGASLDRAVVGMDIVFHLAGAVIARNRDEFFEHNARGTERLAGAIAQHAPTVKRVVYVSSLAATGPATSRAGKDEAAAPTPVSAYGESKGAGEQALLSFRDRYEVVIIRPPIVYGPKDWNSFVVIKAVNNRFLPKFASRSSDGEKYYSVIHAEDLVRAIVAAGKVDSSRIRSGEIFHVSSEETLTLTQFTDEMAKNLGVRAIRFPVPYAVITPIAALLTWAGWLLRRSFSLNLDKLHEIRADYWVCSNAKAREKLGFTPKYSYADGMRQTIEWYRKNGWLKS